MSNRRKGSVKTQGLVGRGRPRRKQDGEHSNSKQDEIWECKSCDKVFIDDDDKVLLCDSCNDSFCLECAGMAAKEYDSLVAFTREDVLWLCSPCIANFRKSPPTSDTSDFQSKLTTGFTELKLQVENISVKLQSDLDEKIKTAVQEAVQGTSKNVEQTMTKSWAEIVGVGAEGKSMKGIMKSVVQEQRLAQKKEEGDREERQANIMIHKVKESTGNSREGRRIEEKTIVNNFLSEIGIDDIEAKAIFRVGLYDQEKQNAGKSRPLKIVLHNRECRDRVMRNLYRLRDADAPYSGFSVGYDLTITERESMKAKVEEAKAKNANQQEYFWKVRGPPWALRLRRDTRRNGVDGVPEPEQEQEDENRPDEQFNTSEIRQERGEA
jgi:hypothetical protein